MISSTSIETFEERTETLGSLAFHCRGLGGMATGCPIQDSLLFCWLANLTSNEKDD